MNRYINRKSLITRLAALALSLLCLLQTQIHAQGTFELMIAFPSVGLAPGQTLRFTLFNPTGEPVRVLARGHSGGIMVGMGDGSVRFLSEGISSSFDFSRNAIALEGEAGTGRIQLSAILVVGGVGTGRAIGEFAPTLEIIEESTGSTVVASRDLLLGGSDRDILSGVINNIMIGIVPGQSLRVTLFNPRSAGSANGHIKIFDRSGRLIAGAQLIIPPGEFRSFEVNRDGLALRGEGHTGRLQLRVNVESGIDNPSSVPTEPATEHLTASFEVIDNSTGRTMVCQNNLKQIGLGMH